ncbi:MULTISPECIES: phage holin family protein [Prevotella]|jgi:uncharacterized protein YqhQ|uniref:Phage holin family protein n=1 Tax=Prevotella lacticifex TaxID=2854755 RepID=A0A9R1CW04_9BACT|nr:MULTISPECIES: phage holin family protein [Prevotella]MDD6852983.1 phage holin family protein [Prevotella sp.]MDY6265792.1 phage holin family protein [Prevotella sp.]GJG35296.1 hypothetical protein PRLR5003_04530 [Prevotella lacticifex]GJG39653.1 hypothetical protein PRLR5019_16240 [Prevotella lacticifex]GJG41665.1 hypothetical protein PRLR5025_04510 [Prevotella lacticifex]
MFSNDNNVETIAQLVEVLKHYIGLQSEYVKLDVIEKVVRLITALTVVAVFCLLLVFALIFFSFAMVNILAPALNSLSMAYTLVGGFYILLLIIFIIFRHRLVERPLVKFLAGLLMSK